MPVFLDLGSGTSFTPDIMVKFPWKFVLNLLVLILPNKFNNYNDLLNFVVPFPPRKMKWLHRHDRVFLIM